jgi:hypothetical protein
MNQGITTATIPGINNVKKMLRNANMKEAPPVVP